MRKTRKVHDDCPPFMQLAVVVTVSVILRLHRSIQAFRQGWKRCYFSTRTGCSDEVARIEAYGGRTESHDQFCGSG